jgi:autotransporter-associated beta strand protein
MVFRALASLFIATGCLSAQWPSVPAADFSQIQLSQFADHELDVPYHLKHFAQVANSVVESPFTDGTGTLLPRGFLNIKVNREPADNKPYNARILEMQMALAYFYTANRPWNPYYNQASVKVRLEAMLQRWTEMQAPDGNAFAGLFSEYSANNFSLAPTGFGVMAAAQTLDLIRDSGLAFDATVMESSRISLRKALMALFTRSDMRGAATQYSNQFSGSYHAALIYLENWPDAELDTKFVQAVGAASSQDQSPAGYFREAGGPDFGYSDVHERNLNVALPRLRNRSDLMPFINADEDQWTQWLAANMPLQPDISTLTYVINAGINTRTSTGIITPSSRPLAEFTPLSRAFALTSNEFSAATASRRTRLQTEWNNWGTLNTNSAYSYIPGFVFDAVQPLNVWHPSAAQRADAISLLPYFASSRFNTLRHDTVAPFTVAQLRRPSYYAVFNTGRIIVTRQNHGLGSFWNPVYGNAIQPIAGSATADFGTFRTGTSTPYEQATITSTLRVNGSAVSPVGGVQNLSEGDFSATYSLAAGVTTYGSKTVTFGENAIAVAITHTGAFTETLPLLQPAGATMTTEPTRLVFARANGSTLTLRLTSAGATFTTAAAESVVTGLQRRQVTISASGSLTYELSLAGNPLQADTLGAPSLEAYSPATGAPDPGEQVTFDLPIRNLLGVPTNSLVATLQASGGVTPITNSRTYGAIAGGSTASQPFSLTANGNFGDPLVITLALQDGATNYGTISYTARIGALNTVVNLLESFDGVTTPALPAGWTSSVPSGTGSGWVTSTTAPHSGARAVHSNPTTTVSEQRLDSPSFAVSASAISPEIRFQHRWLTESDSSNAYDGGVLEISIDGGAYSDVLAAGCQFLAGGYGPLKISSDYQNPLAGRSAWYGNSNSAYTQTRLALPAAALGKSVRLRFRLGCDSGVSPTGAVWRIDTLEFASQVTNHVLPPAITSGPPVQNPVVGIPFAHQFTATGVPTPTFSITSGTLPAGLTLSPTGLLAGTLLSATAPFSITVTVANGVMPAPSNSQTVNLTVEVALQVTTASLPDGTMGTAYSSTLQATGGASLQPYTWSLSSGTLPAGLSLTSLGGIQGTPTVSGTFPLEVRVTDASTTVATRPLTVYINSAPGLEITTASLRGGMVDRVYQETLAASAGTPPYSWSIMAGNPPAGLVLAADGSLGGTPSSTGTATFTARVTDSAANSVSREFTATIAGALAISPSQLPAAWVGTAYSQTLTATGGFGPYAWSVVSGSFPAGISLAGATGVISGTPSAISSSSVTLRVTDDEGFTADMTYALRSVSTVNWDVTAGSAGVQNGAGIWSASGGGNTWLSGTTHVAWVDGCDAVFGGGGASSGAAGTVTLGSPLAPSSLTFNTPGSGNYTLSSGTHALQLPAAALVTTNVEATIAAPLVGGPITKAGSSRLVLANAAYPGDVTVTAGDLRLTETLDRTWNGAIAGAGNLSKNGGGVLTLAGPNTLSGFVTVIDGGLRIPRNDALGTSDRNTTVQGGTSLAWLELVNDITLAEPIQLVMQNTSSHRQIRNISGHNTLSGQLSLNSGGANWDIASLAGLLTIAGPVVNIANVTTPDTWRTLNLHGPAGGKITGNMTDNLAGNSKTNLKIVSGNWELAGAAKAHTGSTTVSGGSLALNTSMVSGVTVQAGATLTGTGSTSGNLAVQTGATIACRISDWNDLPSGLAVNQLIATGATFWTLRLDTTGLEQFTEQARTIPLVTASGGLTNVTPANIQIETPGFPGTGTWRVQTIGNSLALVHAPDLYAAWADGFSWEGKDSTMDADPDSDGVINLLEYSLNGNPLDAGSIPLPVAAMVDGRLALSFQRVADPDLLYEMLATSNLGNLPADWEIVWISTGSANVAGPVFVHDSQPLPLPDRRFMRLRVTRATPAAAP